MLSACSVGIDIGSAALKVVALRGRHQKSLQAAGLTLLPGTIIRDGVVQDINALGASLRQALDKGRFGRWPHVALSLSSQVVTVHRYALSTSDAQAFALQLPYWVEQHLGAELRDLYIDYARVPPATPQETPAVVVAAARKDVVEGYLAAARVAGLRVGVVEAAACSLVNAFEFNYGAFDETIALLDVGAAETTVAVVARGTFVFGTSVGVGGQAVSQAIMQALHIDGPSAENLKVTAGVTDADPEPVVRAMGEVNELLVRKIVAALRGPFEEGAVPPGLPGIARIFLAGGGGQALGLDASLAAATGVPVHRLNAFERIGVPPSATPQLASLASVYPVAVGLGLRGAAEPQQRIA